MATTLANPVVRAAMTHQGVTKMEIAIPHRRNATNDAAVIDKSGLVLRYEVTSWDAVGNVVGRKAREVPFSSWAGVFKARARDICDLISQDAKANGLIGAGTDESV